MAIVPMNSENKELLYKILNGAIANDLVALKMSTIKKWPQL